MSLLNLEEEPLPTDEEKLEILYSISPAKFWLVKIVGIVASIAYMVIGLVLWRYFGLIGIGVFLIASALVAAVFKKSQ